MYYIIESMLVIALRLLLNMLSMTISVNICGNYMGAGTKFNRRKKLAMMMTTLVLKIIVSISNVVCVFQELLTRLDPKNHD